MNTKEQFILSLFKVHQPNQLTEFAYERVSQPRIIDPEKFSSKQSILDSKLIEARCTICNLTTSTCYKTSCGRALCCRCAVQGCQFCKVPCKIDIDQRITQQLEQLMYKCPYKQCNFHGILSDMRGHILICDMAELEYRKDTKQCYNVYKVYREAYDTVVVCTREFFNTKQLLFKQDVMQAMDQSREESSTTLLQSIKEATANTDQIKRLKEENTYLKTQQSSERESKLVQKINALSEEITILKRKNDSLTRECDQYVDQLDDMRRSQVQAKTSPAANQFKNNDMQREDDGSKAHHTRMPSVVRMSVEPERSPARESSFHVKSEEEPFGDFIQKASVKTMEMMNVTPLLDGGDVRGDIKCLKDQIFVLREQYQEGYQSFVDQLENIWNLFIEYAPVAASTDAEHALISLDDDAPNVHLEQEKNKYQYDQQQHLLEVVSELKTQLQTHKIELTNLLKRFGSRFISIEALVVKLSKQNNDIKRRVLEPTASCDFGDQFVEPDPECKSCALLNRALIRQKAKVTKLLLQLAKEQEKK